MLTTHHAVAFVVLAVTWIGAVWGFLAYRRGRGSVALGHVLAPWLYAPEDPRRRLLWFAGATLVAAALAVRAFMTA